MLSKTLNNALAPFRLLASKTALSPTYRALEIGPESVRGCSVYGVVEVAIKLIDADWEPLTVDSAAFLAVVASMPEDKAVTLSTEPGALLWQCGQAKGRLALLPAVRIPLVKLDQSPKALKRAWQPPETFQLALELGGLSAAVAGLAAAGMYGIVLDNRRAYSVMACDGTTISHATVLAGSLPNTPDLVVISPEAAALLRLLLKDPEGRVQFDEQSVYFISPSTRAVIKQLPQLKNDIATMLDRFGDEAIVATLPKDRATAFIKRVNALAETKSLAHIGLSASQGQIALTFNEGTASSDEYFLVEDLDIPDLPEVQIDAAKTARALRYIDEIVLDHVDKHVVVLRGGTDDMPFTYLISGKR